MTVLCSAGRWPEASFSQLLRDCGVMCAPAPVSQVKVQPILSLAGIWPSGESDPCERLGTGHPLLSLWQGGKPGW